MLLLIQYTLIFASVLVLVALGGCFSEHSGVINIGLEGIMVMGALGGALMMKFLPDSTPAFGMILLVVLAAIALGVVYSLLLAVAAINFKADQTLVGTAMNLLGLLFLLFFSGILPKHKIHLFQIRKPCFGKSLIKCPDDCLPIIRCHIIKEIPLVPLITVKYLLFPVLCTTGRYLIAKMPIRDILVPYRLLRIKRMYQLARK